MPGMSKRERMKAALTGKPVDRPPVAFWRHWPIDDQDADALARATFDYQRKYDWDFMKVTPSHTYCVEDYGDKSVYRGKPIGDRDHVDRVIKCIEDWDRIQPLDVNKGAYARQLRCLRKVLQGRDADTPVIQTIFNPIGMARYLADEVYVVHLRRDPTRVERALVALTETCASFARAVIAEGADGIFLSTASASYDVMSEDEYRRFGRSGDLAVLEAASGGWLNILHLHGQHPMFRAVADYPVQVMNWHDRTAWPTLTEAMTIFPGAVAGGVEQFTLLHYGTPDEMRAQVKDALRQTRGLRHIVAAGCTYPVTVPEGNLLAVREAVEMSVS